MSTLGLSPGTSLAGYSCGDFISLMALNTTYQLSLYSSGFSRNPHLYFHLYFLTMVQNLSPKTNFEFPSNLLLIHLSKWQVFLPVAQAKTLTSLSLISSLHPVFPHMQSAHPSNYIRTLTISHRLHCYMLSLTVCSQHCRGQ